MAEENKELTQQELSEQNRIRREKLAQMQEAGKDPFQIVKYDATKSERTLMRWRIRMFASQAD